MNDPQRLLSGHADERERALLSAADAEEPSADALHRLQQTLGLTIDPSPLHVPRARPPVQQGSLEAAGASGKGSALLAGKWLLLSTATLSLVGALAWSKLTAPHRAEPAGDPSVVPTSQPVAPVLDEPRPSAPALGDRAVDRASSDDAPALRDELTRLERARAALRDGRARAALTTLDDYDREHAHGALREEAEALRVDALFALDEVARASELARTFLRSYPHSVHGARVSSQLEQRGAH